jgi:ABC-type dipeptide/oligopeptide/nickel transport system permease subunit
MSFPFALIPLLFSAVVVAVIVIAARTRVPSVAGAERRRVGLGRVALIALAGGAALIVFGFVAAIGEGGVELRGGDKTAVQVFVGMIGGGFIVVLIGVILGVLALVRRAARR